MSDDQDQHTSTGTDQRENSSRDSQQRGQPGHRGQQGRGQPNTQRGNVAGDTSQQNMNDLGPDEVFCSECGEPIKKRAEICPECGVANKPDAAPSAGGGSGASGSYDIPEARQYELEKIANKDTTTVMLLGFLLSPAGYWMIGKRGLALINFLTFNYFLFGVIIVPLHCRKIQNEAREELRRAGLNY